MPRRSKYPAGISEDKGRYRVRVFYRGYQHSVGTYHTLQDAKAALAIARGQIARETFIPPSERRRMWKEVTADEAKKNVTVSAWSELWIETLQKSGASPGTIATYNSVLRTHVVPALGSIRLVDVQEADVQRMLDDVKTPGARDLTFRVVRSMFRSAVTAKAGMLESSPMPAYSIRPKKRPHLPEKQVMTTSEVDDVAAYMPPEYRIAVTLGAWCALRLGELLGLQRRDFRNLDDDTAAELAVERQMNSRANPPTYTPPKSGSVRVVSIPPHVLPELREHLKNHVADNPRAPLLPSPRDPMRPVSQSAFDRQWREARDKVRPRFRFHDLRHTGLTMAAQAGATLRELMERAGHTDVNVALKYQHATRVRDRAIAQRMTELATENETDGNK